MTSRDFYMILPSNVDSPEFPDNKTNSYRTSLPTNLELPGWEVAICEITYPLSWYNLEKEYHFIEAVKTRGDDQNALQIVELKKIAVKSGIYMNGNLLVQHLNKQLKIFQFMTRFGYHPISNKISIKIPRAEKIYLSAKLMVTLGFTKHVLHGSNNDKFGSACLDLFLNMENIYVYSDIIKFSLVGNIYAPLLRIVPHEKKRVVGEYRNIQFQHQYYLPLNTQNINQIGIFLYDNQGELIKFKSGKVTVVLHFRKEKQEI